MSIVKPQIVRNTILIQDIAGHKESKSLDEEN